MLSIHFWLLGHPLWPGWPTSGHIFRESWLFLPQELSTIHSSSVREGPVRPCLLCARMSTVLIVCRSCIGKDSHCEFTTATVLCCPEDAVLLQSSMTSGSCNHFASPSTMVPELCGDQGLAIMTEHSTGTLTTLETFFLKIPKMMKWYFQCLLLLYYSGFKIFHFFKGQNFKGLKFLDSTQISIFKYTKEN